MPGRVVRVLIEVGAVVEAEQGLVVIEAMKMQNELRSPRPVGWPSCASLPGSP